MRGLTMASVCLVSRQRPRVGYLQIRKLMYLHRHPAEYPQARTPCDIRTPRQCLKPSCRSHGTMAFAHMDSAFAQCRLLQEKNQQNNTAAGFPSAGRQREYHASELCHSQRPPCLMTEDCMLESEACALTHAGDGAGCNELGNEGGSYAIGSLS